MNVLHEKLLLLFLLLLFSFQQEINLDVIKELFEALEDNTVLESLSMASTGIADKAAAVSISTPLCTVKPV